MSDDPETVRQIAELSLDTRPLLVLDVDDVVLEFLNPFMRYLGRQDAELRLDSFRLFGNIYDLKSGTALANERIQVLIDEFFAAQAEWQARAGDAAETIAALAEDVEVVMLTAMPHRHRATRRSYLDALGMTYPLVTTEAPKGPALKALRGDHERPVAFIDDMPHNLASVQISMPEAHLFHLTAAPVLRPLLPPLPEGAIVVDDWREAGPKIAEILGVVFKG